MGRDEEGTTARIVDFHVRVRSIVESHGGRVVSTAGDSVFGDFDSVVEALDCAAEIQGNLHAANRGMVADDRIDVRIGLHLGDVIVEEYNVFGEGVNIAARLEQLADPGGIVLSEAVYQQVKARSELPITEIGTRTLKNIEEPIRVFRIGPEAFGDDPQVPAESQPRSTTGSAKDEVIRAVNAACAWFEEVKITGIRRLRRDGNIVIEADADSRMLLVRADVSREEDVARTVKLCVDTYGSLDILVNNAAVNSDCLVEELTAEEWDRIMAGK